MSHSRHLFSKLNFSAKFSFIGIVFLQILLLLVFFAMGGVIKNAFNLPISAAVIGLMLVLLCLFSGILKLNWIKTGSDMILAELVLFFIPCFIGLMKYKDLFLTEGWQLLIAVFIGTICVMVCTAYSVHFGFKLEYKIKQRRLEHQNKWQHDQEKHKCL